MNGSTPISLRRVIAEGASFVCNVERTKWPVRAASIEIGEPKGLKCGYLARLVEQAHRHRLALDGWQCCDANVEHAPGGSGVQGDAAILRLAPLGDVELGQYLQPRRHTGGEPLRHPVSHVQHAVDAVADDQLILLRLDMDVAGPILGCLEDHRVDKPHERRVGDSVIGVEVVVVPLDRRGLLVESGAHRLRGPRQPPQLGQDVVLGRDEELDAQPGGKAQLVEPAYVPRVGDRDLDRRTVGGEGNRASPLEHRQGQCLRGLAVHACDGEIDERKVVLLGERTRDSKRAREPLVDERLRERAAGRAAPNEVDFLGGQQPSLTDHVGDEVTVAGGLPIRGSVRLIGADEPEVRLIVSAHGSLH
jgi:hypothetical protein